MATDEAYRYPLAYLLLTMGVRLSTLSTLSYFSSGWDRRTAVPADGRKVSNQRTVRIQWRVSARRRPLRGAAGVAPPARRADRRRASGGETTSRAGGEDIRP